MTKRKLTLLIITGVLLVIAILQGVFSNISPVKTIKFDAEPYSISVTSNSNVVSFISATLCSNNGAICGPDEYIFK